MYDRKLVDLSADIPGPKARDYVERDKESTSPSYTRAFGKALLMLGCGASTMRFMSVLTIDADAVDAGLAVFEEALMEAGSTG